MNSNELPKNIKWYCFNDQAYLSLGEAIDAVQEKVDEFEEGIIIEVYNANLFDFSNRVKQNISKLVENVTDDLFSEMGEESFSAWEHIINKRLNLDIIKSMLLEKLQGETVEQSIYTQGTLIEEITVSKEMFYG